MQLIYQNSTNFYPILNQTFFKTKSSKSLIQISELLHDSTKSQRSPPRAKKSSLYYLATSMVVSRQSATKAGANTRTFFIPF